MTINNTVLRDPHDLGSYALKLTHPNITDQLRSRATSGNSIETVMPFVRLTSAIELGSDVSVRTDGRIITPGKYFSIGLHSTQTHLSGRNAFLSNGRLTNYNNPFESVYNIFNSTNADLGPVIGTIRQKGPFGAVISSYVRAKTDSSTTELATDNLYASPPGVTSINIERKNNGQVNTAQVEIVIPTLSQFEALAEIFFVPGVTMILEWGSLSSRIQDNLTMLPWDNLEQVDSILMKNSGFGPTAIEIFKDFTYPSNGRYSFIIGKLASFEAKMSSSGEFILSIKLIGPGEQNFAYSIYETVSAIVTESDTTQSVAAGSIEAYFNPNGDFDTLIANPLIAGKQWEKHVIKPGKTANTGKTASTESGTDSGAGQAAAREEQQNNPAFLSELGDAQDAVFVSWKFFVNIILNSTTVGIKKLFVDAGMTSQEEINQIRILHELSMDSDDPDEPHVGGHTYLRSTNPAVCVVYNAAAEYSIRNGNSPWKAALTDEHLGRTAEANAIEFTALGSFIQGDKKDKGLLSRGVWLNAHAIKQSLMGARTLHEGIANLLNKMNASVGNYWELTLDYDEQEVTYQTQENKTPISIKNFLVVDRKYRGTLDSIKNGNIYKFNKFYNPTTGIGSELIDFNVGLNTPPLLMTQLAFSRPATETTKRGVVAGAYDSSMQNLFESVIPNGLSLIDIDIVRRNIQGSRTNASVGGRGTEASSKPGANSSNETPVMAGQATRTREVVPVPPIQRAAEGRSYADVQKMVEYTDAQLAERKKRRDELIKSMNNPQSSPPASRPAPFRTSLAPSDATNRSTNLTGKITEIIQPRVAVGDSAALVAKLDTGATVRRIGNRNWRNNNPGNIEFGTFARTQGAIGSDGRFAIFPDYNTGRSAKATLLFEGANYKNLKISNALARYAPASENDTVKYQNTVIQAVGGDYVLSIMTKEQREKMLNAMEKVEGFKIGTVELVNQDQTVPQQPVPRPPVTPLTSVSTESDKQEELDRLNQEIAGLTNNRNAFTNVTSPGKKLQVASNKYPLLRSVFTLIEFAPHLMTRMFLNEPGLSDDEKNKYEVNNNLKYSLNPLEATLTLPGISGIRIGELVRLGRMPKRLFENRGAWQILGITDTINPENGWITNLRCRFMPLPPIVVNSLTDI